jgi:hypothetical protein
MRAGATGADPEQFSWSTTQRAAIQMTAPAEEAAVGRITVRHEIGGPAGGHDPARMTTDLPIRRTTAYSRAGDPVTVTETAGGKTRTTTSRV